jgi:hypothetical protein
MVCVHLIGNLNSHIILATGNNAAVVVTEYRYRFADQVRSEDPLTAHIEIVTVN